MSSDPRRQQRVARMQALFAWSFHATQSPSDEFLRQVESKIPLYDATILRFAPKHGIAQFHKVDLAILRQALYELEDTSTPPAVVVNEAIELAKRYGSDESATFIAGVLGNILDDQKEHYESRSHHLDTH